jgi:hypothetical protein
LKTQAFARRARAYAGRLEMLQVLKSDVELFHPGLCFGRQQGGDLFQRLGEISIFVQRIDEHHDESPVALIEVGEGKLR